jgi:cytidylate kinase
MPGVTISSGFGAGGSVVARTVAGQLGLTLIDRAISAKVAANLQVTVREAEDGTPKQTFGTRFLHLLAPLGGGVWGAGTDAAPLEELLPEDDATQFREQAEQIMGAAMNQGAVILGRAGAAAFQQTPGVLRVRLFGDRDKRAAQAARIEGLDEQAARELLPKADKARDHYVRRLYKVSVDDPALFHLQIDSTVLSLDACADVIVSAYRSMSTPDPAGSTA